MRPKSVRRTLAGAVGGIAVLGALACVVLPLAVAAMLAVTGWSAGRLLVGGDELLALALAHAAGLGGILLYRYRSAVRERVGLSNS